MPTFSAPGWLGKEVAFAREKLAVRARSSEKTGWRRTFNIRSTQAVDGLPANIPGAMVWSKQQYNISFGWKAILPIPANGLGLHPRDDKGVYLICDGKSCTHSAGTVTRLKFNELAQTIQKDYGLQTSYGEDFIYGQFYRADGGTHTFVRLLPSKVEVFDDAVLDLLRARRMLRSLPFLFAGMEVMADLLIGKVHGPVAKVRARYLNAWRHALAMNRACEEVAADDKDAKAELAKGDKADLKKVADALGKLLPDKDGKWSTTGVKKAASAVARAFFGIQEILLKKLGDAWLGQLGLTLKRDGATEEYRFPVDEAGRAVFKNYLDQSMAVRQLDDRAKKNAFKPYTDAVKKLLADSASDVEVMEIFGMQMAYTAFAEGFSVDVPAGLEKVVYADLFDLGGTWTLKHRFMQPQDDPDYAGFVVSLYQRQSGEIWIVPRGTASEDGEKTDLSKKTRDQADKKNGIATGVEADGDPAGCAYHAVKKYKKELLQKLKDLGATPATKFLITGHSLGGALTERLHLALYEAGYRDTWSLAFSPPAPDGRTIAKALYKDDQMGPAAFDRLTASGGTWDVVTKGGDTGACIPLRLLCIRPWAPGTFTPVPYSVVGDNTGDQRFLQHGTMFQHECRYAGFALVQSRKDSVVKEDTDRSYVVYDYCKDVTVALFEATRTPWGIEQMLTPDKKEHQTRVEFSKAPATDAERNKQVAAAKSTKMLLALVHEKAVPQKERGALEKQIADAAVKAGAQAKVMYVGDAAGFQKKGGEATWAKGFIFCLGALDKDQAMQNWVRGLKVPAAEVHPASWKQTGQGQNEPKHFAVDGSAAYLQAVDWLAKQIK